MNRRILAPVAVVMAGAAFAGCGGGSSKTVPAATLLPRARTTINAANAVHFAVTSNRLPTTGTVLTSGEGDLARPNQLSGDFQISVDGLPTKVSIIETGGKFYVKLPFASRYQLSDPSKFGFGDPAKVIDPNSGVSHLLTQVSGAKVSGHTRINGEALETVTGTVPGASVTQFLPDADPSKPVAVVLEINPTSAEVRQVQVTGPFASTNTKSTYVLTLTKYNESVTITAPPT